VVDERFDIALLADLVDTRPDWNFVIVGPVVKIDEASLPRRVNLTWLGQQSYDLLPHLVSGWDVCLLPFALNESTRFISPTKTLEYLAAEKPVVSTAVRDVVEMYGDVVRIGGDAASFLRACGEALAETEFERVTRVERSRDRVAAYSWDHTVDVIEDAIAATVAGVGMKVDDAPMPTSAAGLAENHGRG
jgi:glycosyltransferase involved in cell wall biosynthesis